MKRSRMFLMIPLMAATLVACGSQDEENKGDQQESIERGDDKSLLSPDEFQEKMKEEGIQLVDVRTPGEYASGHVAGAVNIDFQQADFEQKLAELDKTKPIMVYCERGGRSGSSVAKAIDLGFKEVYDLDGGMSAWREAGKPTE